MRFLNFHIWTTPSLIFNKRNFIFAIRIQSYACLRPCAVAGAALVRTPLNTAVVQGSSVTLECISRNSTTLALLWSDVKSCADYTPSCGSRGRIYSGFRVSADSATFSVTEVDSATHVTRNLNIDSTQLNDAGVYLCAELIFGVGFGESSSAYLIVLGIYTNLSTNDFIWCCKYSDELTAV